MTMSAMALSVRGKRTGSWRALWVRLSLVLACATLSVACGDDSGPKHGDDETEDSGFNRADGSTVIRDGGRPGTDLDGRVGIDATLGDAASDDGGAQDDATAAASLTRIQIGPEGSSFAKGTSKQLKATGIYSDNTTRDLTPTVSWSSSDTGKISVSATGLATAIAAGMSTITVKLGDITGTTTLTVTAATLTSVAVTPFTATIGQGLTKQFTATGTFSDGTTQDVTADAAWTSSTIATATIDAAGLATAVAGGNSTITATLSEKSGTATLTVSGATLDTIEITTNATTLPAGSTTQLSALAKFSDNTTQDVTKQATWSSSSTASVNVSDAVATRGLATAVAQGTATITATLGAKSGTVNLNVTAASLQTLTITPGNASFAVGTTQPFTATGQYSDGTTQDLTASAVWTSSANAFATIGNDANNHGVATAVAAGNVNISAAVGAVSAQVPATVTPATLTGIEVTPALPTAIAGSTKQFRATGTYSDGSTQDVTATATWSSSAPNVADISNSAGTQGLASALVGGDTTITAAQGGFSGTTILHVSDATLLTIVITPNTPTLAKGTSRSFTATGSYNNGTTQDLTTQVTWSSSDGSLLGVSNAAATYGQATALAEGHADVTATFGNISGSTTVTISPATLTTITLSPANASIVRNTDLQFTAQGTFSDGSTQDVTQSVTWVSSVPAFATISNAASHRGTASGSSGGTTTISATKDGITGSTMLTVSLAMLQSITVTPAAATIGRGTTQQYRAIGNYEGGLTVDITRSVSWSSDKTTVAYVSNAADSKGLLTAVGGGTANITASYQGKSNTQSVAVLAATLQSITVTPANAVVQLGLTQRFTATGHLSDQTDIDMTAQVTWASSHENVALVSNLLESQGTVSPVSAGATTISATSANGVVGQTDITVQ